MDKKLAEKLEAIRARMERAGSVGEAEAAALAYQRVLLRHNLTEQDAERASAGKNLLAHVIRMADNDDPQEVWRLELASAFFHWSICRAVRVKDQNVLLVFGTEENVAAVRGMYETALLTFLRLAPEAFQQHVDLYFQEVFPELDMDDVEMLGLVELTVKPERENWILTYLRGCAYGIFLKLQADRKAQEAEEGLEGLVLVKEDAVERFMADVLKGGTETQADDPDMNHAAFWFGVRDGRNYHQAPAVPERATQLLALQ